MKVQRIYKVLKRNVFESADHKLVPIRHEDRILIMKWRNEQIYHLRQSKPLTEDDQDKYFQNVVAKLMVDKQPNQLLFSYLENNQCIGYGGLVHINWLHKNAEISFIIKTELEQQHFHKHWQIYLGLIEQVAFDELNLHKIYTYAFDFRPHLYKVLEDSGYLREAVLTDHCIIDGEYKRVVIHCKINQSVSIRRMIGSDKDLVYDWANDQVTRDNSFNSNLISAEEHDIWFTEKLNNVDSYYFICEVNENPAGLVRFDLNGDIAKIGILIDARFRGKGLAPIFIKKCCAEFKTKLTGVIEAYVRKTNTASIKSFERAGFAFVGQAECNGIVALKYQLSI